MLNTLDIAFVVGALAVAAVTFTQPPLQVAADIVAIYVGSVLAGLLYIPATRLPILAVLPGSNATTVRLTAFIVLLIGGTLVARGVLRRVAAAISTGRGGTGGLTGNLVAAMLAVLLAVAVLIVAVVVFATLARMPTAAGIVTYARTQTASSQIIPRLAQPLAIYLQLVTLAFPGGLPDVFMGIGTALVPL